MIPVCGRCFKPMLPANHVYTIAPCFREHVCMCPVPGLSLEVTITYTAGTVQYSEVKRAKVPDEIYRAFKDSELEV